MIFDLDNPKCDPVLLWDSYKHATKADDGGFSSSQSVAYWIKMNEVFYPNFTDTFLPCTETQRQARALVKIWAIVGLVQIINNNFCSLDGSSGYIFKYK